MISLLERSRKINKLLQKSEKVDYFEVSTLLSRVMNANVYIISKDGKLLGYACLDNFECDVMRDKVLLPGIFPAYYVEWLLRINETSPNLTLKDGLCAFSEGDPCLFNDKFTTIVPIHGVGERIGTLIVAKFHTEFNAADLILAEYGATVVGMEFFKTNIVKHRKDLRHNILEYVKGRIIHMRQRQGLSSEKNIKVSIKNAIHRIPVPAAGLMLGLAALGNLLSSYGNMLKTLLGLISLLILVLLLMKITCDAKAVMEDLQNPAIAGIASTFPMGIIVLSTYLHPFWPLIAYGICGIGTLTHCVLIIYFTKKFILNFNIQKVFPSYFVVYVGIAIFSVIAPVFNVAWLGQIFFWFGFIAYLILLPIIIYRVLAIKALPEALLPTLTIFAAPASLCLVGYLNSFQEKNMVIVWLLTFLSLTMLLGVLLYMPRMIKLKFFPSYSAFTFPFVISAIAIKTIDGFLLKIHLGVPFFSYLIPVEELLSTVFVIYVLVRYISFLFLQDINVKSQTLLKQ